MKNRILLFAMTAFAAVGMISCGNSGSKSENFVLSTDNVDELISSVGQYTGLTVEASTTEITDDMVEYYAPYLFAEEASSITDHAAEIGDTVVIDYVGKINGVAFDGGTASDQSLLLGSNSYIDGFEEGLVGALPGDVRELELQFPDDYSNEDLAGKACTFTVTVDSVAPAFTDEGVALLNSTIYSNVSEYKSYISEMLASYETRQYEQDVVNGVLDQVIASTAFNDFPESFMEEEKAMVTSNYQEYADSYGVEVDYYLELLGTSLDEQATEYAEQHALFYKIAKDQSLEPTEEQIQSEIDKYINYYDEISSADDFYAQIETEDELRESLLISNVYDYLLEVTTVTEPAEE